MDKEAQMRHHKQTGRRGSVSTREVNYHNCCLRAFPHTPRNDGREGDARTLSNLRSLVGVC